MNCDLVLFEVLSEWLSFRFSSLVVYVLLFIAGSPIISSMVIFLNLLLYSFLSNIVSLYHSIKSNIISHRTAMRSLPLQPLGQVSNVLLLRKTNYSLGA